MSEEKEKLSLREYYYERHPLLSYLSLRFMEEFSKEEEIKKLINNMGLKKQDDLTETKLPDNYIFEKI